jgi:hypothetical protein
MILTLCDVRLDSLCRDTRCTHLSEKHLQVIHVLINSTSCLSLVDLVVLFHECREILEPDTLNLWSSKQPRGHLPFFLFQEPLGLTRSTVRVLSCIDLPSL